MKFTTLLSAVAVVCSCMCCVNASATIGIEAISECNNKIKYGASYNDGMSSSSKYSYNACDLAGNLNSVSDGVLSVGSSSMKYINSNMGSYFVGPNDGGCRSLVVLDDVKYNGNIDSDKIAISSVNKKNPVSFQFCGNGVDTVKLPNINFNDVPLVKLKNIDKVGNVTTNTKMGVFYSKNIQINGGVFDTPSPDLTSLGLVLDKGTNNFKFIIGGTKYRFCGSSDYNIPGITDVLAQKGLYVSDIRVVSKDDNILNNATKMGISDVNKLTNNGAGLFAVNCNPKYNGFMFGHSLLNKGKKGIVNMICHSGTNFGNEIRSKITSSLQKQGDNISDFIIIEIC